MRRSALYIAIFALIVDLVAVSAGLLIAYYMRANGSTNDLFNLPFTQYLLLVIYSLPIWLTSFWYQGMYRTTNFPRGWRAVSRTVTSLLIGWGVILITLYLSRLPEAQTFPRLIIVYGLLFTALLTIVGRLIVGILVSWLYRIGLGAYRVVIVGGAGSSFVGKLKATSQYGRKVIKEIGRTEVVSQLAEIFEETRFDEVIVASNLEEAVLLDVMNWAEEHGCNFAMVPSLLMVRTTNIETVSMAGAPVTYFLRTPLDGWGRVQKRILDILIVLPALIIALPIFVVTGLLIKIFMPGPILFAQSRIGQDGRLFKVHKLRRMYVDADQRFQEQKGWSGDEKTDPRITPLGRVLRRTDLDELPQLFDVLIGNMSLVGPRPEQPKYVERFIHEVPQYLKRHYVKTGLTGWAQINGLRGDTSIPERVKYDLEYIQNWSIAFDLRIIASTIIQMLRKIVLRVKDA